MTQEKAERLAREIASGNPHYFDLVKSLCNHILSGDHKREIENAAFRTAIERVIVMIEAQPLRLFGERYEPEEAPINRQYLANFMRNLIQPPAQKENGE